MPLLVSLLCLQLSARHFEMEVFIFGSCTATRIILLATVYTAKSTQRWYLYHEHGTQRRLNSIKSVEIHLPVTQG